MSAAKTKKTRSSRSRPAISIPRFFTEKDVHPFDGVKWSRREAKVGKFEQKDVEFPEFWSENAVNITASKYFRGKLGSSERETNLRQMLERVVKTIRGWGEKDGYFSSPAQAQIFEDELTYLLLNQKASFNSPVWFNVGVKERPQCSACFILSVEDSMSSILDWIKTEGTIFKGGSGSGINLSNLRSGCESLSGGGLASGPVSFMRGADSVAGMIKSGGTTRRAAKMVILNIDHPDILKFIRCKADEEKKVKALIDAGFDMSNLNDEAWGSIQFQNANNSVRITDDFMKAVETDGEWRTHFRTTGAVADTYRARDLLNEIAQAAWESGDPGVQFDTIINNWHTCPNSGRINASNPCFTGDTLIATNRGLIKFEDLFRRSADGERFRVFTDNRTSKNSPANSAEATVPKKVMMTGINDIYRLAFSNGMEVKTTKNHRFFTLNRGMVPADQLKKDDKVVVSRQPLEFEESSLELNLDYKQIFASGWGGRQTKKHRPVNIPRVWTTLLANYIGYIVGDGSVRLANKDSRLSTVSAIFGDQEEASELIPHFTELFGSWGVGNWQELAMPNSTVQLRVSRTPIVRMLVQLGLSTRKAPHKVVPSSVFEAPLSIQSAFLSGLFTADGCVYNGEKSRYVGLGSTSTTLLKEVQQLLLAQGIFSRIYDVRQQGDGFFYKKRDGSVVNYPSRPSHDLRISGKSILRFKERIGFLTSRKQEKLNQLVNCHKFYETEDDIVYLEKMEFIGKDFTYNLTELKNHSYIANSLVVANCSEYMHLDNSACNLASLNLLKFLNEDGTFDVKAFKQAVDAFILAQEIIVGNSNYPTPEIAKNADAFRELGLGFTNLGALLMTKDLSYDSEQARAWAGAITSLMTGEAYRFSAEISGRMGPFDGFSKNREPMLGVIEKHSAAANGINGSVMDDRILLKEARNVWQKALVQGAKNGFRNSQVSVIAPTGTISFMMDCDTTGVEPDFSLVKMKQLVGGGWMKIVNASAEQALLKLGYSRQETDEIISWIYKKETIEGAPNLKEQHLPIFDCAVKPAAGSRSISWKGHVKMVAAVQPFVSGAVSKTFNMSAETTRDEIAEAYIMAWKMGIKAFAVYRDGSKAAQPLSTGKKEDKKSDKGEAITARRHLPPTRISETHKFSIVGHEGYLTYSMFQDGTLAEIFVRMAKQGSTLAGLLDSFAISVSMALQYGVPFKNMAQKFIYSRFEPSGVTKDPDIRIATSIVDYIFRYLAIRFLPAEDLSDLGITLTIENGGSAHAGEILGEIAETVKAATAKVSDSPHSHQPSAKKEPVSIPGDSVCRKCGGMMVRTGTCMTCLQCGASSGGCS